MAASEPPFMGDADRLFRPYPDFMFPNGWATLTLDASVLSEEEMQKLFQVEDLLGDLGIHFDSGLGFGGRDWELNASLTGAKIRVKPLRCMHEGCNKPLSEGLVYWTVYRDEARGRIYQHPYCSAEHRMANHDGSVMLEAEAELPPFGSAPKEQGPEST